MRVVVKRIYVSWDKLKYVSDRERNQARSEMDKWNGQLDKNRWTLSLTVGHLVGQLNINIFSIVCFKTFYYFSGKNYFLTRIKYNQSAIKIKFPENAKNNIFLFDSFVELIVATKLAPFKPELHALAKLIPVYFPWTFFQSRKMRYYLQQGDLTATNSQILLKKLEIWWFFWTVFFLRIVFEIEISFKH